MKHRNNRYYAPDEVAAWAKRLRIERQLSQKAAAALVGVSQAEICHAELGKSEYNSVAVRVVKYFADVQLEKVRFYRAQQSDD